MNDMSFGNLDLMTMTFTPPGPLSANVVAGPANGAVSLNSNGSFTYTPAPGFFGSDSFTYQASDGTETSNIASVSINVMNTVPNAFDDSFTTLHDQLINVSAPGVLMNDFDADGDLITATLVTGTSNGSLTFNSNGSFAYSPNSGYVGSDGFAY